MIGQNSEPIELLLYILSLYLKDSLFKARQVTPWLLSPFSVCPFPYHQICNPQWFKSLEGNHCTKSKWDSQLVLVMINCRTLEAVYFLRWGMQSFRKPPVSVFQNLWSMFDSTQAAALVALYSSFMPEKWLCLATPFPMRLWLLRSHLKCFSVLHSVQHHSTTIHLSCYPVP